MDSGNIVPKTVSARMELLAALERAVQESVRQHPDCVYQDTDSVVLLDTPGARAVMLKMKAALDQLYGKFGVGSQEVKTHGL